MVKSESPGARQRHAVGAQAGGNTLARQQKRTANSSQHEARYV
jgi:hypothetical protein